MHVLKQMHSVTLLTLYQSSIDMANQPNETIASVIAEKMTQEKTVRIVRFATGDQFFVYAVTTEQHDYVLRLTNPDRKPQFMAGIDWQKKLIPLGIPLAPFINTDLNEQYSPFPALLMKRLPGDDLCNVYSTLSSDDKKHLALEMIDIQGKMNALPEGAGYGIMASYEAAPEASTWFEFIKNRLMQFKERIHKIGVFDISLVDQVMKLAIHHESNLLSVQPKPFLWDASERNVLVHEGKITGIVDVDDLCFGDSLFVIALTHVALACDGHDTLYTDYWTEALALNAEAKMRLAFYQLFYVIVFMVKHGADTSNKKITQYDVARLNALFENIKGSA